MDLKQNRQNWEGILRAWEASGKRRSDFCREENLKVSAFDYWRRKLRTPKPMGKPLIEVGTVSERQRPPMVGLKIGQRYTLEFREDIGEEHLRRILNVLRDYP